MSHGRMELRHQGAASMLATALKVCRSAKTLFLLLALLSAAFQTANQRYGDFTLTIADENTTLRFTMDPKASQPETNLGENAVSNASQEESLLNRLFSFSISFTSGLMREAESLEPDIFDATGESSSENGDELPALKVIYAVGNGSGLEQRTDRSEEPSLLPRFRRRRLDQTAGSSSLFVPLLLLLILAGAYFLPCFNQSIVPALVSYSVITAYMGKRLKLSNALVSGLKIGIRRLMWLSALYAIFRSFQYVILSRVLLRNTDDIKGLVLRLSSMPFAFLAPLRDEKIVKQGISKQVAWFLAVEWSIDGVAYAIFIVASWVTIMEGMGGFAAFRRGWSLVKSQAGLAIVLTVLGSVFCGRSCKWVIQRAVGSYAALFVVDAADLYIVVAWMVFYLSARSKLDPQFGHGDLEDFFDRVYRF